MKYIVTTLVALTLSTGAALAQDMSSHSAQEHAAHQAEATASQHTDHGEVSRIGDPWPLETCIVSGEKLGEMGDPIIKLYEGREFRFCCKGCVGKFEKEPEK